MGRRREDILGDGKAVSKGAKSSMKVRDTGNPAGKHWELSLGSMARSWRALKVTGRTWVASEGPGRLLKTFYS